MTFESVVRSVHVGRPREATWAGYGSTAIDKRSIIGPVRVEALGLEGDQVADTRHHGGPDKAVYAFARDELDHWAARFDRPVPDGLFGENLTTAGLDVDGAELGERWAIGTAVLEVASVRTPCAVFQAWLGRQGYDSHDWLRRFIAREHPGAYLRVVVPGVIAAGDTVEVVHRPGHGVTASMMFQALMSDRSLLPRLLEVENLTVEAKDRAEAYLRRTGPARGIS